MTPFASTDPLSRPQPSARARGRSRRLAVAAFALAFAVLFVRLGDIPLLQPDEGRNAEIAREMQESGAWLVPTFNGFPYLDKPAFYFKLAAFSMSAFGKNEAAARLPSALFGLALLGLVFAFCRRAYGERTAALAVFIVGTTPLYVAFSRMVIFDIVLAFFVCAAVMAAVTAEDASPAARRRWYALGAAAAALATLVKGPVGFIVPGLVVIVFRLFDRRAGALRRYLAPVNLLVFFAIVLPWFFGVTRQRPDFPDYGIIEETFRRYATPAFHRVAPFYYYAPVVLAAFFPWSALLPECAAGAWRSRRRWARTDRLFVIWALVVVLFFSTSQSKLPGYVLTAVIAAGVLAARVWARAMDDPAGRAARLVLRATVVLAATAAIAALLLAAEAAAPGRLQAAFRSRSAEFARLSPVALPAAISLGAVAVLAVIARVRRRIPVAFVAFLVAAVLPVAASFEGLREYAEAGSSRSLARAMPALDPSVPVVCLECFPGGLPFYMARTLTLVTADGRELTSQYAVYALRKSNRWPSNIVPRAQWDRWIGSQPQPIYLLAKKRGRAALEAVAAHRAAVVSELRPGWWGALVPAALVPAAPGTARAPGGEEAQETKAARAAGGAP